VNVNAALIEDLLESWQFQLEALRRSPNTVKTYGSGVRAYLRWCAETGQDPDLSARQVTAWQLALTREGRESQTVLSRQVAVRRFTAWLAEEEPDVLPDGDPLSRLKAPRLDEKVPRALTEDQISALLQTAQGRAFHNVRDRAIILMMADSLVRASELLAMTTEDLSLRASEARVRRGKEAGRGTWPSVLRRPPLSTSGYALGAGTRWPTSRLSG
jgi:integrase/recombinase XerD